MAMDVSTLAIEVKSTGIKEASDALGGLSRTAGNLDKKVSSLTANLANLLKGANGLQTGTAGLNGSMAQIAQALAQASANANATARALAQVTNSLQGMTAATNQSGQAIARKNAYAGVFITTLKAMGTAFLTYGLVKFTKGIVESADAWQLMQARLTVATGSLHNAKVAQQDIFEISQRLRQPLEETVKLYTRMAPAMQRMGKSHADTTKVVEGVGMALKLSGATAGESASAMLQLSQSFNAGRLNGAEFNAIAEAAPKLLDAMALKMGKGREELKKLGSDGKITGKIMAEAIAEAAPKWEEQFKKLPITVGDALTRVGNAWTKAMGELGEKTGFNTELAKAVGTLESLIPSVRDELAGAFIGVMKWVRENKTELGHVWTQVKGILGDVWEIASAFGFVAGEVGKANTEMGFISTTLLGFRLALAGALDFVTLLGAGFLRIGGYISKYLAEPLVTLVSIVLRGVVEGLGKLFEGAAFVADKLGQQDMAAGFNEAAKGAGMLGNKLWEVRNSMMGGGEELIALSDKAVGYVMGQDGAVNSLIASYKELNKAAKPDKLTINEKDWGANPNPTRPGNDEADKERKKHLKDANDELQKQLGLYREQAFALADLEKFGLEGDKRTALRKQQTEIEYAIIGATEISARRTLEDALAKNIAAQAVEKLVASKVAALEAERDYNKSVQDRIDTEGKELIDLERKVATFGMAKGAIEDMALAAANATLRDLEAGGATEFQIQKQLELIAVMEKRQAAAEKLGGLESLAELEKLMDPRKAEKFGASLESAFGKAGKSFGLMIKGLENYGKREADIANKRKLAEAGKSADAAKYNKLIAEINEEETIGRLKSFGEIAQGAKEMFKEHTAGYKLMEATERGFRAAEMAMALDSFLLQNKLIDESMLTQLAADAKMVASALWASGQEILAKMGIAQANAVAGVANQANGDPYSAFPRMAAMAAIMAGLGLAVGIGGGGGGGPKFDLKAHQAKQGTGTILGDDEAKSESILNALERVRDNSNIGLEYSANMVASLRNIEQSLGGFTKLVASTNGLTSGSNFGIATGTTSGGGLLGSGLFGSKTSSEIIDAGLVLNGRVGDFLSGNGVQQYADVQRTKKSWYGKTRTWQERQLQDAGDEAAMALGGIFSDINKTIVDSVAQLGGNADMASQILNNFGINFEVSLKDLKGDDLKAAIEAVISSSADSMARTAFAGLDRFQQVGEGYYETMVRVATGNEQATDALKKLGVQAVHWSQLQNADGDVGVEMVRESLMAAEAGTSLHNVLRLLDGSMEELIDSYKTLTRLRDAMDTVGLGRNISLALIRGAGGVGELESAFDTFFENFYSDAERQEIAMSRLRMEFGRLGVAVPDSRDEFRSLVQQMMASGEAGHEMAGRLLSLSGVFNDAMELMDEVQGQAISDAKDALREAYDRESESLENLRDKMQDFADGLRDFRDSLIMSDLSTKSEMEKYQTALSRYNDVSAKAMAGDEQAIEQFEAAANELLQFSRSVNASGANYTADFERVLRETELLAQYTEGQADQATQSLELLKQQVKALIDLDESVKTVADAIRELQIVLSGGTLPVDGSHADGLANVPYDGYIAELHKGERVLTAAENSEYKVGAMTGKSRNDEALCDEIKALRDEVRTLKEEQREQTQLLVASNYDANEQNARTVVAGTKEATADAAYVQRTQIGLN